MSRTPRFEMQNPLHCYLPPHISLCVLDDGVIVLNLKQRRYLSLPGECVKALAAVSADWIARGTYAHDLTATDHDVTSTLTTLVRRGILTHDPNLGSPVQLRHISATNSIDFGWGSKEHDAMRPRHAASFFIALLLAIFGLRLMPFDRLVMRVRRRHERLSSESVRPDLKAVKSLVIQFRRLRPLVYSSHEACLFDSVVLLEYLALHSVYPTWVLGVDSRPFRAHSWIQYDGCVLNGTVEYVEQFTPILIV